MDSRLPSSALRDLRAHFTKPTVLVIMAGMGVILGLSGPFNTLATLPFIPRLAYWAAVVVLTYAAGFLVTTTLQPHLDRRPVALRVAAISGAVTIAVTLVLLVLNRAFGQIPETPASLLRGLVAVLVICLVITIADEALARANPHPTPQPAPTAAPLLLRLPLDKRGALVSISVQDHYVDVTTTKGHAMLLLRLGDAIRETVPLSGLQVHRSHWVARDQITAARRKGDAATLTLSNGDQIPVSRAYLPAIRAAGLLPARTTIGGL